MSDSKHLSVFDASELSEAQIAFCEYLADRSTIEDAIKKMGWNAKMYYRMRHEQPAFDLAVLRAREMAQDAWVDQLPTIAQTEPDVQRARLLSDNVKWAAARIKPGAYGDRLDVTMNHTIDITAARAEALARVANLRPRCDPDNIIDVQVVDVTEKKDVSSTDKQSVSPLPDIFD